jgi:two-component system, chemotaxis family, chemotaxis protein CheY
VAKRVLIVDDAPFMRLLIKDAVVAAGHQVVGEAEDGEQGVALFLSEKPDVVTMDLVMPKMSGLQALREILKHDPAAKVIVISAVDQKLELKSAISAGAFDFIVKPFDTERIRSAIARASGLPKAG